MSSQTLAVRRTSGAAWSAALVLGALFLGRQIVTGGPMIRVVAALVVVGVLAIPAIEKPKTAVLGLFVLLPFLGVVRHIFMSTAGAAHLDPLLLITSAVAFLIFVSLTLNGQMDWGGTALSKVVFFLLVVGLIQVFNPGQGGLLIGFTGVMINLIPIAFFFIARSIADAEMTHKVIRIVMAVGVIAALYGLSQVFFGFRGFEQVWLSSNGYGALNVGGTTRPFSIFNNAAEYAAYAHYAVVAGLAAMLFAVRRRRLLMLGTCALIAYAGFLTGSRGFTVKVVLAAIVLLGARARNRALAAGIVAILVSLMVLWSANTTSNNRIEDQKAGTGQLIEQQLRALRDPLDRDKSTVPVHFEQFREGITFAVTERPFGLGTGVATRGGAKFGGLQAGTELDIGDAFLSLGILGGLLYVAAIVMSLQTLGRVRRALPGHVWIAIWAMALTSVGAWLNGGNYSITPLLWFMIGAADGAYKRMRARGLLEGQLAS